VPRLRGARFATEVIERYGRREPGVEEAMMEMCFPGVSTRDVGEATGVLWGGHEVPVVHGPRPLQGRADLRRPRRRARRRQVLYHRPEVRAPPVAGV